MKLLKDMITGADNSTVDIGRVCLLIVIVVFCYLTIVTKDKFDPQTFGIGAAAIAGGFMGGLALKKSTEPVPTEAPTEPVKE